MLRTWQRLRSEWGSLFAIQRLPAKNKRIVFYSEGAGYWTYFEPIVSELVQRHGETVIYVTSSPDDPILGMPPPGIIPFQVGRGTTCTLFFATLVADALVMTMPDLHEFHIKRSPRCRQYVYVHHSMVSTHMIYRASAFDHFDAIFCVGPHHLDEIRVREEKLGLRPKKLIAHGYGRLDTIEAMARKNPRQLVHRRRCVVVAPSWGQQGLLEQHGAAVIQPLMEAGFDVILRPHPRTRLQRPDVIRDIVRIFGQSDAFTLDLDADAMTSLLCSDLMVSDWSGAALEFAFGVLRPVVFIDLPRKINNSDYADLGIEPLEVSVRDKVGVVLQAERLDQLGQLATELLDDSVVTSDKLVSLRQCSVFNVGRSGKVGASALVELVSGQ